MRVVDHIACCDPISCAALAATASPRPHRSWRPNWLRRSQPSRHPFSCDDSAVAATLLVAATHQLRPLQMRSSAPRTCRHSRACRHPPFAPCAPSSLSARCRLPDAARPTRPDAPAAATSRGVPLPPWLAGPCATTRSYFEGGAAPTAGDDAQLRALPSGAVDEEAYPHIARWQRHIGHFKPEARSKW